MREAMHTWGVYLLHCADGSLYCGSTNHLERRLLTHNNGKGARYTRSRLPVQLAFWSPKRNKSSALRAEALLKGFSRAEKLLLLERAKVGKVVLRPRRKK
jgi:putative endonuclease